MWDKQTNKRGSRGFTIVELLIVIVVIGILAAITIVAYNGIQQRANNTRTANAVAAYLKGFSLMLSDTQTYPTLSTAYNCLGQATCRGATWTNSTTLDTQLKKYMGQTLPVPSTSSATDNSAAGTVSIGYMTTNASVTLDGTARNWIIYSLDGSVQCPVGPVASGSWPEFFSTPPASGRTSTGGSSSSCYIALPNA